MLRTPPNDRRGLLPLLLAAMSVGKGIYGMVDANQRSQKNKGYIGDAYRTAQQRMTQSQNYGREDLAESLGARGLSGYSPIQAAMMGQNPALNGAPGAPSGYAVRAEQGARARSGQPAPPSTAPAVPVPHTIGEQQQLDTEKEFALDRHALDAQHERDLNENKANLLNAEIGGVTGAVQGVASAYSTGQMMSAMNKSQITNAMLSGSSYGGINPVNPTGDPSSAWHVPTRIGDGGPNYRFNIGGS